jgi:hypothetical protein
MAQRYYVALSVFIKVVEPRPPSQVNVLSYERMHHAQNASPDAYVSSQVAKDRISSLLENIRPPDQQGCCKRTGTESDPL